MGLYGYLAPADPLAADDRSGQELHPGRLILNVTQPALTVQIRRLEEALGVRLFDRDTRSVELTRVARELMPAFERTLQDLDAALGSARDIASQVRGVVRLAALPSVAAGALPDAIRSFRDQRPNVMFDLKDVIASQVLALVRSEEVDFGVMGGAVGALDVETVFESRTACTSSIRRVMRSRARRG